jgi:hypothetical protein
MKRTSLIVDRDFLKNVMQALGATIYSAAVNLSLAEILRVKKVQELRNFFGKGLWEGDLGGCDGFGLRRPVGRPFGERWARSNLGGYVCFDRQVEQRHGKTYSRNRFLPFVLMVEYT